MIYRLAADTRLCRHDLYNAAEGIVMYGRVGRAHYRPAADNSIGYETITVR
jgi:hypothetical protein